MTRGDELALADARATAKTSQPQFPLLITPCQEAKRRRTLQSEVRGNIVRLSESVGKRCVNQSDVTGIGNRLHDANSHLEVVTCFSALH